jgi:aspartyl protease family protein
MQKLLLFVIAVCAAAGLIASRGNAPEERGPDRRSAGGETRIERSSDGHFYVDALVNDEPVRFMIDTGASGVALTMEDAERIGLEFDPNRFRVVGSGASGPVHGEAIMIDSVDVDGKTASDLRGAVLEGLGVSLLGQEYLAALDNVEISGDEMVLR